jgi:hypothetical protein
MIEALTYSILLLYDIIKPFGLAGNFNTHIIEGYYAWDLTGYFVGPSDEPHHFQCA